jgi:lipopolysaccharide transport system permease protein
LFARFISFLRTLYANRYMIKSFALADLKKRYAGSFGGLFWSVIQPLFMIFTYYLVFSFVFKAKVEADYGTSSYTLWLMGGLIPWLFFSETLSRSTGMLQENRSLVTKTLFPSEILPICLLVSALVSHLIGLAILVVFAVIVSGGISPMAVLIIPYFFLLAVLSLGFSWALSSMNVFIRDIGQFMGIALNLWFFYTPIIFPMSIIPERFKLLFKLNPMYHVVEGYRRSIISGAYPDYYHLLYLSAVSALIFVVGGLLYKRLKPAFVEVL